MKSCQFSWIIVLYLALQFVATISGRDTLQYLTASPSDNFPGIRSPPTQRWVGPSAASLCKSGLTKPNIASG